MAEKANNHMKIEPNIGPNHKKTNQTEKMPSGIQEFFH